MARRGTGTQRRHPVMYWQTSWKDIYYGQESNRSYDEARKGNDCRFFNRRPGHAYHTNGTRVCPSSLQNCNRQRKVQTNLENIDIDETRQTHKDDFKTSR